MRSTCKLGREDVAVCRWARLGPYKIRHTSPAGGVARDALANRFYASVFRKQVEGPIISQNVHSGLKNG